MTTRYPDDCIQTLVDPWWAPDPSAAIVPGRLVRTWVPFVGSTPRTLESTAAIGSRAAYQLREWRIHQRREDPSSAEVMLAIAGKVRPALVVGVGPELPRPKGASAWPYQPLVTVAPYFGVASEGSAGLREDLVTAVRHCAWPQWMWDRLPIAGASESLLRLDQPVAVWRHHDVVAVLPHRLSEPAMDAVREQIGWLLTGELPVDGAVALAREMIAELRR